MLEELVLGRSSSSSLGWLLLQHTTSLAWLLLPHTTSTCSSHRRAPASDERLLGTCSTRRYATSLVAPAPPTSPLQGPACMSS
jgi:hypothetical protein